MKGCLICLLQIRLMSDIIILILEQNGNYKRRLCEARGLRFQDWQVCIAIFLYFRRSGYLMEVSLVG